MEIKGFIKSCEDVKLRKWVRIKYKNGWYPEGNECILTESRPDGNWGDWKYAIHGFNESRLYVALWPVPCYIISAEEIGEEEADAYLFESVNGSTLKESFYDAYLSL